jgi:hypothetical protein
MTIGAQLSPYDPLTDRGRDPQPQEAFSEFAPGEVPPTDSHAGRGIIKVILLAAKADKNKSDYRLQPL